MTKTLGHTMGVSSEQRSAVYAAFYERYGDPRQARLLGSRVLHFNEAHRTARAMHLIVHELIGHEPIRRARPLDITGRAYDTFTYKPEGFSAFTTDGDSTVAWRTNAASVRTYDLIDSIRNPFLKDGVPVYARDLEVYLELQDPGSGERAWLEITRFGNEGTMRLHDGSMGWILGAAASWIEQSAVLPAEQELPAAA